MHGASKLGGAKMVRLLVAISFITASCWGVHAADDESIHVGAMVDAVPSIPCPSLQTFKRIRQLNDDVLENGDTIHRIKILQEFANGHCPPGSRVNLFSNKPLKVYVIDDESHGICVSRTSEKDCQWIDMRNASPHLADKE
jgi:hypothetical protein